MSMDPAIKLFGKTIALPLSSEEGGGDDDKGSPEKKEQESPNSEEKSEQITTTTNDTAEPEKDSSNTEENQNDSSNPQDKPQLKKPDKILPCPRCNSMDTKFCYYNNYNVNQPRHFCKNCQRYWTAGGTMRNVPVGAGRRKNKNSASSHFRHITISDSTLKPNGSTVLSFGSDAPLCDSIASVLNLAESKEQTAITSNSIDNGNGAALQSMNIAPHFAYVNGSSTPWPYPWASPPPLMYPGPYWGYGNWSMPWISPMVVTSSSPPTSTTGSSSISGPISPLGKHSREGNALSKEQNNSDANGETCVKKGNVWIPKTLRIDDPEEAAKSSIWATMGFSNDKSDRGLFKPFPKKSSELNNHAKVDANSQLFRANPAALSRSINFQENT